ncbi:MAG: sugar phosphate isomerase/epimerase [Planctomycetota bacterium]
MKLSVCPQALHGLPLDRALRTAAELGIEAIELPVDARNPWFVLDDLLADHGKALRQQLRGHGLGISAVANHQEGQLLLGPHHADTDAICAGTKEAKIAYAQQRLLKCARLASDLEVGIVVGFVGCEDQLRLFPWPDPAGWEKMWPRFHDLVMPLLMEFERLGVSFAQEPHPKNIVYNVETALESVRVLDDHPRWCFNLDPANLMLAGVDPLAFVRDLAARTVHVHAKDGQVVRHNVARSGLLAHGPWDRPDRGFRFRIPGWGDLPWRAFLSELRLNGYDGYLAIENEDPVFEPIDGLRKAVAELRPLLPVGPRQERWW